MALNEAARVQDSFKLYRRWLSPMSSPCASICAPFKGRSSELDKSLQTKKAAGVSCIWSAATPTWTTLNSPRLTKNGGRQKYSTSRSNRTPRWAKRLLKLWPCRLLISCRRAGPYETRSTQASVWYRAFSPISPTVCYLLKNHTPAIPQIQCVASVIHAPKSDNPLSDKDVTLRIKLTL